jgi:hypothetical protein
VSAYLKVSNKLRKALLNAVSKGILASLDAEVPECRDGPPEKWNEDAKARWDVISRTEFKIIFEIEKALTK